MRQNHDRFSLKKKSHGDDSDKSGKEYKSTPALVPFHDNINTNVSAGSAVAYISPLHALTHDEGTHVAFERLDRIRRMIRNAAWLSHVASFYKDNAV